MNIKRGTQIVGVAVVAVVALAGCGTDGPVTVHDKALDYAERCYDADDDSDGTTLPGTRDFEQCVDYFAYGMADYYRAHDVQLVDGNGGPVKYSSFTYEVGRDLDSWLTDGWTP